jgi:glycosyltransferase involved in cell wall biosynthesis
MSAKNNRQVIMVPDFTEGNPYQKLLSSELEALGIEVKLEDYINSYFPFSKLFLKYPEAEILHLHWLSPLLHMLSWTSPNKSKIRCLLIGLDCLWLRLKGKRLIWTIHNKFAHEQFERSIEMLLRKILVRCVSKIIVHSKTASKTLAKTYGVANFSEKANIIFHGNYDNVYPEPIKTRLEIFSANGIVSNDIVILCFGLIRPYKGLDKFASAFTEFTSNQHLHLVIAGKSEDVEYTDKLKIICNSSPYLHLNLGFLDDLSLSEWINAANIIAIPFSDTLTSGSVLLAMTKGKALLLSEKCKVFDCVPDQGAIYFTELNEIETKIQNLTAAQINSMGTINAEKSKTYCWSLVAKCTASLYFSNIEFSDKMKPIN